MPLTTNADSVIDDTSVDCITFTMHAPNGFLVFCIVTAQALRDLDSENEPDLKKVFHRVRQTVERKASDKYDHLGGDGRREIIITNSD